MSGRVSHFTPIRVRRATLAASAASVAIVAAILAGPADATLLGSCPSVTLTQPFLPWGDSSYNELAPGGDFEASPAGWALSGGAARTSGSESYGVTGKVGAYSLALPAGATALSPQMCVTSSYPWFRLFVKSATASSSVRVEVVYQGLLGLVSGLLTPSSGLAPSSSWQPTARLSTAATIPTLLGTAELQLRFTGLTGTSQIDDVYVDPNGRG